MQAITHTPTHTQNHTLNYSDPHTNTLSHNTSHTLALYVFQRPLRLPKGSTSGCGEGGQFIVSYEEHVKQTRDSTDG